jgi:hypothetical protein
MTRRPAVQIRPFRIFVIAELVDGKKYAAVSESEVDCDLGNGMKSREPTSTSGDPCCRGSPKCTYSVTSCDFVGDGRSLGQPAQGLELQGALLVARIGIGFDSAARALVLVLVLRSESSVSHERQTAGYGLLSTATGESESTGPGEGPTGASAEREGGLWPPTETEGRARAASAKCKGAREARSTGTTRDTPAAPPSRGVARGCAKDPTDDPAELHVLF